MKPTTLNHPDAPDLNFKWNGRHTVNVRQYGRDIDVFTCGDPCADHATRAQVLAAIDAYITRGTNR